MKQEECQNLATASEVTIIKAEIVFKIQTRLGTIVMISSKYLKWKKMSQANLNWKDGNKYFRGPLWDVEEINKLATGESGLTANNVINKEPTEHKIQYEMDEKLGKSFDNIEMAETAKSKTINAVAQSISKLASSNSKLTATIKKLTS